MLSAAAEFILHSSQLRGLIWWSCKNIIPEPSKLSERQVNSPSPYSLFFFSGRGEQIWESKGGRNWSRLPQALLSNQNVIPPTGMKLNPTGHHKRLFQCKKMMFQESNLKLWGVLTLIVFVWQPHSGVWSVNLQQIDINSSFVIYKLGALGITLMHVAQYDISSVTVILC